MSYILSIGNKTPSRIPNFPKLDLKLLEVGSLSPKLVEVARHFSNLARISTMSSEGDIITAPVMVFVTTQKGDFVDHKFYGFKSTIPRDDKSSCIVNSQINIKEQKIPLKNILQAVCDIAVECNSSEYAKDHLPVKIGQGVNLWMGQPDPKTGRPVSVGHKTMNHMPLYSSDFRSDEEEWVWVMKR